ncbi:NAD(P)H-dependent oxidoreductase [Reichenbachiella versicolor]|uniref:NAD(P)H-dependent oxidoreductase n=1 Tax=Reichenbachiella versicolor TaxID=1821036 RepID=UPI000D6E3F02|nr:NAD(P)H-dependent oxidoreductase [Reichenbachiella versicolor]
MKKILIINGHPDPESYNQALFEAYKEGLKTEGYSYSEISIGSLNFNPSLVHGYRKRTELEPDLKESIAKIKEADHIVWIFPMWWYGYPAIMKGFIDRTFLPGITYQPIEGKPLPKKLLEGKSSRIIITADSPRWYERLWMGSPVTNQFKKGTLQYCGINPVKVTYIAPIKNSTIEFRTKWIEKVKDLGKSGL